MVARGESGLGDWIKKVKGLTSTNWKLQNIHGECQVQHREYSQCYGNNHGRCQVGTGNTRGNTM